MWLRKYKLIIEYMVDDYYVDEDYAEYAYISHEMYKEINDLDLALEIDGDIITRYINELFEEAIKQDKEKDYEWLMEAIYEKLYDVIEEYTSIEKEHTDIFVVECDIMNELETVEDIEAGLYRLYKSDIPEEDYNARLLALESKKEGLELDLGAGNNPEKLEKIVKEFIKDMREKELLEAIKACKEMQEPKGEKKFILYTEDSAYTISFENGLIEMNGEVIDVNDDTYQYILDKIKEKQKELG